MSRLRYSFSIRLEVPGSNLGDATERALRLFRPRVRTGLKQSVAYLGAYKGAWLMMSRTVTPPADRVDLKKRARRLAKLPRPERPKAAPGFLFAEVSR